jgi:hypothetical protein
MIISGEASSCSIYAAFMQHLCSIYAAFMQHLCSIYEAFMQHLCSIYAEFMQLYNGEKVYIDYSNVH